MPEVDNTLRVVPHQNRRVFDPKRTKRHSSSSMWKIYVLN